MQFPWYIVIQEKGPSRQRLLGSSVKLYAICGTKLLFADDSLVDLENNRIEVMGATQLTWLDPEDRDYLAVDEQSAQSSRPIGVTTIVITFFATGNYEKETIIR